MNKILLGVILALGLLSAGCGSSSDTPSTSEPTSPNLAVAEIPNPIIEFETVEDAVAYLDFDALIPYEIPDGYSQTYVLAIESKILEIGYDKDADNRIYYRTGTGAADISGFYDSFTQIKDIEIDGKNITTKGNEDLITVAFWQVDDISYSLAFPLEPADEETISSIISSVR